VRLANNVVPVQGGNGLLVRVVDAGRVIGYDAVAQQQTTWFTVVSKVDGTVVTLYPGLPR
jgi:hypothetical protein